MKGFFHSGQHTSIAVKAKRGIFPALRRSTIKLRAKMDIDKAALYVAKRTADLTIDASVFEIWDGLRSSNRSWFLLEVDAAKTVTVTNSGTGGVSELVAALNDDACFFGAIRSNDGKFIRFFFVGANVGGMKKGKASLWKNSVFGALEGGHGSIELPNGLEDVGDELTRLCTILIGTPFSMP